MIRSIGLFELSARAIRSLHKLFPMTACKLDKQKNIVIDQMRPISEFVAIAKAFCYDCMSICREKKNNKTP